MTTTAAPAQGAATSEVRNPFFARLYHRVLRPGEGEAVTRCRRRLLEGLTGRVLETSSPSRERH